MQKVTFLIATISVLSIAAAPASEDKYITRTLELIVPDDIEQFKAEIYDSTKLRSGRISNGFPATDTQFPFVGDVTVRWRDGPSTYCTAGLIATDWILTARRCIINDLTNQVGSTLFVEFGSASRAATRPSAFGAWAVWKDAATAPHPDFALFRLGIHMTISTTINVIQLPTFGQMNEFFQRAQVVIAGWGALDVAGTRATTLQWADYINTTPFECTPDLVLGVTPFDFCSKPEGFPALLRTGDFGAPVILFENGPQMPPTLIGVASAVGLSMLTLEDEIISMQIGQFLDFIHDTTGIPWRL